MSRILPSALLVLVASLAGAAPPSRDDIARWVRELGSNNFRLREEAQKKLWQAGRAAEPELQKALVGADPEIKRRAGEVLTRFRWGIYPETPKAVVDLIGQYQTALDGGEKIAVVQKLFDHGPDGCIALIKIAAAEEDENARRDLHRVLSLEAGRVIPQLLPGKDFAALDDLLERTVVTDRELNLPHYVAYHLLRGDLDNRIALWTKRAKDAVNPRGEYEVLCSLYRAKGDLAAARSAAEKAHRRDLLARLLEENGQWAELARLDLAGEGREPFEAMGYRAAYHRLAGNVKEYDEVIAQIKKFAADRDAAGSDPWLGARSLFLNHRPADALALIAKGPAEVHKLEILAAQMRFADALAFADKVRKEGPAQPDLFEVVAARVHHFLGDRDRALKTFRDLGEKVRTGGDTSWFDRLVETEWRLGFRELAYEHGARALEALGSDFGQSRVLKVLFPGRDETALAWWGMLRRRQASEQPSVTMKNLRAILGGTIKLKELKSFAADADAVPDEQGKRLAALAEVALLLKEDNLASSYFSAAADAGSPDPLVRWGDLLVGKKKYKEAAEAYGAASLKDRRRPLPLFLRGRALELAGDRDEGRKLQELAHWMPMGDEGLRADFARALSSRGYQEASRRERDLLRRTAEPGSFQTGEMERLDALEAQRQGDHLRASRGHAQAMLRCFRSDVHFIETASYVMVPLFTERLKARGLIAAGKMDEARKVIDAHRQAMPAGVDLAIALVPVLEKHGEKKLAAELFAEALAEQKKLIKDFPKSGGVHNSLAWLCACCRRELALARSHAETAVKLEPDLPGYRDTLAEVLFQMGHKDEAIAQIKRCLATDPHRDYYRRQLRRFEAGDRLAEVEED